MPQTTNACANWNGRLALAFNHSRGLRWAQGLGDRGQGGTKTNNRRGQCTHVASGALRLLLSFLPLNWSPKELRRHKRFSGLSGLTPHDGLLIPLKPPQLFRAQWPIVRDDWGSTCTQSHAEHARTILSSQTQDNVVNPTINPNWGWLMIWFTSLIHVRANDHNEHIQFWSKVSGCFCLCLIMIS